RNKDIYASMGPRLFRRGNPSIGGAEKRHENASMGPRLFRRGNCNCGFERPLADQASMGPRLFRRGNVTGQNTIRISIVLQWGHDFSAVEMYHTGGTPGSD